jgi:uncharacterized membrane protein
LVRGFFVARAANLDLRRVVLVLALRDPARHCGRPGGNENKAMRNLLLIVGFLALAIGLLWIGQGTGVIAWPRSSFMISQIQWAGYGAALAAVGLILIWQSKR